MSETRDYSCKDVVMLMTSQVIAKHFSDNIDELSQVRTNWDKNYASDLVDRIGSQTSHFLGTNARAGLLSATNRLNEVIEPAVRDLSSLKKQIDLDFSGDPARYSEILSNLGFSMYYSDLKKKNQPSLIAHLYAFKQGLTDSLRQEILDKGTPSGLLDRIGGYADVIALANAEQEQIKGNSKNITAEMIKAFNGLYHEIMAICKIASDFYYNNDIKKECFTFSKIAKSIDSSRTSKKKVTNGQSENASDSSKGNA